MVIIIVPPGLYCVCTRIGKVPMQIRFLSQCWLAVLKPILRRWVCIVSRLRSWPQNTSTCVSRRLRQTSSNFPPRQSRNIEIYGIYMGMGCILLVHWIAPGLIGPTVCGAEHYMSRVHRCRDFVSRPTGKQGFPFFCKSRVVDISIRRGLIVVWCVAPGRQCT
jgi:hypothetical protein